MADKKPRDGLMVNYQELAQGLLLLARDDTHRALADLRDGFRTAKKKKLPKRFTTWRDYRDYLRKQALGTIEDIAVFITSEWCEGLCGLVGADYEAYRDIVESALNEAWELAQDELKDTPLEVSDRAIDCILYNRRAWREKVDLLESRTATAVVALPLSRLPGDPVGQVATTRATVTSILDTVDRALRGLPKEHQRIADFKWGQSLTHNEIADRVHYSVRTVERRVNAIRASVRAHLVTRDRGMLSDFWRVIDGNLSGG